MADTMSKTRGTAGRFLIFLLVCYSGFFLFFFIRAALSFPSVDFLPKYLWSWVFSKSFLSFNSYFLAIHLTGTLCFYSLVFSFRKNEGMPPIPSFFHSIATSAILILLILTFVFVLTSEWVKPKVLRSVGEMKYNTELARGFFDEAQTHKDNKQYAKAREAVENYLRIDPESIKAQKLKRDLIELQSDKALEEELNKPVPEEEIKRAGGFTSTELIEKAQDYFTARDYSTAHYYANLALALDPGNGEAKTILAKALQRLSSSNLDSEDEARSRLFQEKKKGYDALQRENILEAYYIFKTLRETYPEDPDIEKFFALTKERLGDISFFIDEIEGLLHLPGYRNILFVNEKNDNYTELVSIGKLHILDAGIYLEEIEVIRLSSSYKILFHFTAPYGKIIGNLINMHAVDRSDPGGNLEPVYLTGNRPENIRHLLPLGVSADSLRYFSSENEDLEAVWLPELWQLKELAPIYGYRGEPYHIEFMLRIVLLFSFFVLSLFAMAAGWSLRPAWGKPPIISLIFLPLFPFILKLLTGVYLQGNRLLLGYLFLALGFVPTAAIFIALQLVLAAGALILLAGQTMKT